ncbi:MAG: molybdopterin-dependent oxidoreductase [Burkholderiales bacterium]|nr:molybdopterin-dependent oxidoreductase [Burkholderiales bacterium]
MKQTRSTCPYCGVGCGVIIQSQGDTITGVRGDTTHPANFGRLCTKGSTLHLTASPAIAKSVRLLAPQRRSVRGGVLENCTWELALQTAATRFAALVQQHGANAVGFYVSGQLLTEDYYVFNKLAKGLVGTNNIDTNSRLCMSSAVAGYKKTLGADAPPACYEDVDHAATIFMVGSNTAWAHPVLFRRIEDAKMRNPALKIIFCDPRKTDTAEIADLYLPVQPGTDVMLFNGLLHIMLWENWIDTAYIAQHTEDFEALKKTVRDYTVEKVSAVCGIAKEDLFLAAQWFSQSKATLSLYCQGLNQSSSGTDKNMALINLHLATGQIGKPGAGPFSLTGQPNAMGGREVGGLANLLSAHRDLSNPMHREEVAALWGVDSVPESPGKTAVEMFQAAADGEIKALWIACTNPAQSMPDQALVRAALKKAEFVVVQEAYGSTATAAFADVLLPATTWGEKTGTVTNSERRISRVRAAVAAPGQTRHDWAIACDFAQRLAPLLHPERAPLFSYPLEDAETAVEMIWNEHRESTRGRDLDITGLSYALLEEAPRQWPMPEGAVQGKARLYEDGRFPTETGRAHFANVSFRPVAEPRESRFPFSLITGRLRDQWHCMSRTGTVGRLFAHVAEPCIQMHPQDMDRRSLHAGDLVQVTSKRGSIVVPVQASQEVALTQAFMAMHWGSEYLSGCSTTGEALAGVNALTTSAFCPDSKQPELKHAAVKIEKATLPWSLLAVAWLGESEALKVWLELRALMPVFSFATCVPFSNQVSLENANDARHGLLFRAAAYEAASEEVLNKIEALMGLQLADAMRFQDRSKGIRRTVRLVQAGDAAQLQGFLLAGDVSSEAWIKTLLQQQLPAQTYGRLLLVPGGQAPVAVEAAGKQICTCFNVTQDAIESQLSACAGDEKQRLQSLQTALKCGSNCGSCLPELKRLVRQTQHLSA